MAVTYPPGLHVELVDPPETVEPGRVDIAAFVVVCERGPVDRPVRVASWRVFEEVFGSFVPNGLGAYAVKSFFDNGGLLCYVVRVAAPEHVTTLTGAQPTSRRLSVLADVTGFVPGAAATVRLGDQVHQMLVTDANTVTSTVTWDRPLPDALMLTDPALRVATGAAAAATELVNTAGTPILRVAASGRGSFGDRLAVRVSPGRRASTASRTSEPSIGRATPVDRIDGFAVGSLVRVTQVAPVVWQATRVVAAVDAARRVLTWDTPLPALLDPTRPLTCETDSFTLSVLERGDLREVHEDLVLVRSHARYAPAVIAALSILVRATDLTALAPSHPAIDQPGAVAGARPLVGGRDGTAAMVDDDVLGDELAGVGRGLATLADVDEPAAVAMPDLVAERTDATVLLPPEPPDPCVPCPPPVRVVPVTALITEAAVHFDDETIARVQQAMVDHCERRGDRLALLDPPAGPGPLDVGALRGWRARFDSSFACLHAPWLRVVEPLPRRRGPRGGVRRLPPSGHVAGLLARVDTETGPWLAPANRTIQWAVGCDLDVDDDAHALLNESNVNVLRARPGRGVVAMGARTLSHDIATRPLNVRRLLIHVNRALRAALAWSVFEPADHTLDVLMATVVTGFAEGLWEGGALVGGTPADGFRVRTGLGDRGVGEVIVELSLAPARANEMILLRVSRTDNRLELSEQPERSA